MIYAEGGSSISINPQKKKEIITEPENKNVCKPLKQKEEEYLEDSL